jgi:PmbA protein
VDLIQQAKLSVDQAELFTIHRKSAYTRFSNGSLDLVAHRNNSACALRVLKNGKLGASYGQSSSQEGLLDDATAAAAFGQAVNFGFATDRPTPTSPGYNEGTAALSAEDLVEACSVVKSRIAQAAPDAHVNMVCQAESGRRVLETSEGVAAEEAYSRTELSVEVPFPTQGTMIGAAARIISNDPIAITDEWIDNLLEMRSWGEQASAPSSGRLPAILTPYTSSLLTLSLAACLSGSAVCKGVSALAGKVGEQVLSSQLTIREDAKYSGHPHARSVDDEGVACQPRVLIEKGILRGYLTDLSSAVDLGQPSTGNALRRTMFSEKIEDVPTASWLGAIIEPGETSWRDLIAGIDEGILVTRISGLHSSNLLQGQFSVQANGFHIRKGKVVGYLEKTMMSGNIFEDFRNIRAISSEREPTAQEPIAVAGLAPYILLDSVQLTVG